MTVYIAQNQHTRSRVYHTNTECPYLKRTGEIAAKDIAMVDTHREQCSWCDTGEIDKPGATEWHKINRQLKTQDNDRLD